VRRRGRASNLDFRQTNPPGVSNERWTEADNRDLGPKT